MACDWREHLRGDFVPLLLSPTFPRPNWPRVDCALRVNPHVAVSRVDVSCGSAVVAVVVVVVLSCLNHGNRRLPLGSVHVTLAFRGNRVRRVVLDVQSLQFDSVVESDAALPPPLLAADHPRRTVELSAPLVNMQALATREGHVLGLLCVHVWLHSGEESQLFDAFHFVASK